MSAKPFPAAPSPVFGDGFGPASLIGRAQVHLSALTAAFRFAMRWSNELHVKGHADPNTLDRIRADLRNLK